MLTNLLSCVIMAVSLVGGESSDMHTVCRTDRCKELASHFLVRMNPSADPCDNFYEFACGRLAAQPPEIKDILDSLYRPKNLRIEEIKLELLRLASEINNIPPTTTEKSSITNETPPTTTASPSISPVKKAIEWFALCIDKESIDARGIEPIQSILSNIGGWPMAMNENDWNEAYYPWKKVSRYFAEQTGDYFLWDVVGPERCCSQRVIIRPSKFPRTDKFPRSYEPRVTSGNWAEYRTLVSDVVKFFARKNGVILDEDKLLDDTTELIEFENQLFGLNDVKLPKGAHNSYTYTYGSDDDDPKSKIKWTKIVEDLFKFVGGTAPRDIYISFDRKWIFKLQGLLINTPQRVVVNYLHWRFIEKMLRFADTEVIQTFPDQYPLGFRIIDLQHFRKFPRWNVCANHFERIMPDVIAYLYGRKYYTKNTEESAIYMASNLRSTFIDEFENSTWLDETARTILKRKLNDLKFLVAFPDWYHNETKFNELFKELSIGETFFETQLSSEKFLRRRSLEDNLGSRISWRADKFYPLDGPAYASILSDYATIHQPYFDVPRFSIDYPPAVNYGKTGFVIGHEIAHHFDIHGICYGTSIGDMVLSKDVLISFYDKTDCFVDQFNAYDGNTNKIVKPRWPCRPDGVDESFRTIGEYVAQESMAETIGLQAAFRAFKKLYHDILPKHVKNLPGLENLSEEKLFFLSYGVYDCGVSKRDPKDKHGKPDVRINGAVSNSAEFATAFNCPKGAPMNPINKCKIWGN